MPNGSRPGNRPAVWIDPRKVEERFIRASGPGGQNVNKVSTAVQLCYDVRDFVAGDGDRLERLKRAAGSRLTADLHLIVTARRFRSQDRNRQDAHRRLLDLLEEALIVPSQRRPTRPTLASRVRLREAKSKLSRLKRQRQSEIDEN